MHITSKGQVTIPKEFRELCGLYPNSEVEFMFEGGRLVLQPMGKAADRGTQLVEHLLQFKTTNGLSADEIMNLTRD
jgi:antitoxin PrlF